jgi:DNA-binding NarL/FixJ family response regulator
MAPQRATGSRWSALVADGDGPSREQLRSLLERIGCAVREAPTGEEALRAARAERPSIVVLNVDLPGLSGYEVCRELREEFGETLPIIFISATRILPADEIAGLLVGADDYMIKPISADRFLARVRRNLARAPAPRPETTLTPRENEVLGLLVAGRRVSEIAADLCISAKTASAHIEHILHQLGVHTQAQAVALALRDGLIRGGETS